MIDMHHQDLDTGKDLLKAPKHEPSTPEDEFQKSEDTFSKVFRFPLKDSNASNRFSLYSMKNQKWKELIDSIEEPGLKRDSFYNILSVKK